MTNSRISFFVRDWRDLREKRRWSEASFVRVAPVALVAPFSPTCCERRDTRCVIRDRGQVPC
jgi:hypothetical protein